MSIGSNLREATRSLLTARQRTLLALIGVVIGVGSVIAMVSIGTITQQEALRQFQEMGTDILSLRRGSGALMPGQRHAFTREYVTALPGRVPEITALAPYISLYDDMRVGSEMMSAPALGVDGWFPDLHQLRIQSGRFLTDLDERMSYCVIGPVVAEQFATAGVMDPVGRRVVFRGRVFKVIGVVERVSMEGMRPYEINEGIMIPLPIAERLNGSRDLTAVTARTYPGVPADRAAHAIERYFQQDVPETPVEVLSAEDLIRQMKKQMQLFTLLLGAIGSISLLVGGIGVMNVMLVSVSERRREIGIRRALGAHQSDIQVQFLVEAIILCMVGGVLGVLLGIGVSWIVAHFSGWQWLVSMPAVILGLVVATVVGVFFGLYPARQAARLNVIEALRDA